MEERRKFVRYPLAKRALYHLRGEKEEWKECVIIDVSSKGMGIRFLTPQKIKVGSTILLEIPGIVGFSPTHLIGIVRWIKQSGNEFMGGIESTELFDDTKLFHSPLEE